jgi:glutamine synthetase
MVEDVLRPIRLHMRDAGFEVEDSKGECNLGQHEVNFRYQDALRAADDHAVYKTAAKEIAYTQGAALTFIAKFDEREGNSCHIHCSLWEGERSLFPAPDGRSFSPLYEHYIAGQLARTAELAYFFAPNVNSYKRFAHGSFAPTGLAWGHDNRTCAFRAVGHGSGMRLESRLAGGDVNPYLAVAATIAAGLDGIDRALPLPPALEGNAYDALLPRVPASLHEAVDGLAGSAFAREAFGDEVVDHYLNAGRQELRAFEAAVTDWELVRGFERL